MSKVSVKKGPRTLLSDTGGPITAAVAVVNRGREEFVRNDALVTRFLNAVTPRTRLVLLTHDRAALPPDARVLPVDIEQNRAMTIFAQDPFLVLTHPTGRPMLLESNRFDRRNDRDLGRLVAAALGIERATSSLAFEGGNIVSDERFVFVGSNTIHTNAETLSCSLDDVIERLSRETGRPVFVAGAFPQPVWHIDMILTPLGQDRALVADARSGARLAEDDLRGAPEAVDAFERSQRRCLDDACRLIDIDGQPIDPLAVASSTADAIASSHAIADALDGIADALDRYDYGVTRIPYLQGGPPPPRPGLPTSSIGFPTLTYNNVLTETHRTGRTVYLPQYGWSAFDEAARSAWSTLGYEVRPIDQPVRIAMAGGSLRCCVKVVRRAVNLLEV